MIKIRDDTETQYNTEPHEKLNTKNQNISAKDRKTYDNIMKTNVFTVWVCSDGRHNLRNNSGFNPYVI